MLQIVIHILQFALVVINLIVKLCDPNTIESLKTFWRKTKTWIDINIVTRFKNK